MGKLLALDVGGRRIGVAEGDEIMRIAYPATTVIVDGNEVEALRKLIEYTKPVSLVVGFPRNQKGEPTEQTATVQEFAKRLESFHIPIVFQDESLTSILAEQYLKAVSYTHLTLPTN
jgi:putative Holliday junction resolvase